MKSIASKELVVVGGILLIFTLFLFPALMHARRETRDGIRRNEVAAFKTVLEQYYNEHETYPLTFDASPHRYVVVEKDEAGASVWYLQAELENSHAEISDYDAEEGRNYHWRYLRDGEQTVYEVCGGTPTCDVDDPRRAIKE